MILYQLSEFSIIGFKLVSRDLIKAQSTNIGD
jgi:hypothetical protein